jgi:hypothetical protein
MTSLNKRQERRTLIALAILALSVEAKIVLRNIA